MVRKHKSILRVRESFFNKHHKGKGPKDYLTHEEQAVLKKTFSLYDTDHDGRIKFSEVVDICRKYDISESFQKKSRKLMK